MPYKDIEKRLAASKAYYQKNREKKLAYAKAKYKAVRRRPPGLATTDPAAYQREWNKKNKEKAKLYADRYYLKGYGITLDRYNEMLASQNGLCDICGKPPDRRRLVVDHDHHTGVIRGLLCHGCNLALGKFGDDIAGIEKVLSYLRKQSSAQGASCRL